MKRRLIHNALWLCMAFGWLGLVSQSQAQDAPSEDVSQQQAVTQELAKADDPGAQTVVLGMTLEAGADGRPKVTEVSAASSAWDAGIREGDVITSIDGLEHSSAESYVHWLDGVRKLVGDKKDGQSLAIEVNRDGTPLELRAMMPESQIEEARKQKQKEEEQLQNQQIPQYPDQLQTPIGQQPQQPPYPYDDNRGGGFGAFGFGGDGTATQGTNQQGGSQMGTAMARLFAVNSSGQRGTSPNQPNQQNQPNLPNQPNNQNQPNQFTPGANPIDQSSGATNNNAPENNHGQTGPATINAGQDGTLQQRIGASAEQNSNAGAQATGQTSPQTTGQISTQQQQTRRDPRQTQGQDQGMGQGQGSEVGSAMFQDDQRGMLVTVETIGLQGGNYLVAIADEGTLQTEGNRGSIRGMPQQQGMEHSPQQQGIQQTTPQQSIPRRGTPGAREPNTGQPGQQQMNQPATQSPPAQPRSSAIFGDTEFFSNAQEGASDPVPQGEQDSTPQDLGDPSPNLDAPTSPADAAANQNQTGQNDPNQQDDSAQDNMGSNGTGGGALVRIGVLQVGQDGVGQLRQNVPNVRVDQIVGMAVAIYSLAGQSEVPNMEPGSQSELPAGAKGSLVAVGIIQHTQPNAVNGGNTQNPQDTAPRRNRPAGGTSDGRIDQ